MIKLKNIMIEENIAKCEIVPEDSKNAGRLEVDLVTKMITECSLPIGYEWCKNHVAHAKEYLLNVSKSRDIPTNKMIMWY